MKRLSFRTRVLLNLVLFALVPASALLLGGAVVVRRTLPTLSGSAAWEHVGTTGQRAIAAARQAPLTPSQRAAIDAHEQELSASMLQARRFGFLTSRVVALAIGVALLALAVLALLASRVAGHLSRQLSRPLKEIVEWTGLIARREPLPAGPPRRGAPEFDVLRERMRAMAGELESARAREREAERLEAFRETARQVAHELKNPLTPIGLAVSRLKRDAAPELSDVVEVLETETKRLEAMARSFSQFGRLPEGPPADVDVGELARAVARPLSTAEVPVSVEVDDDVPLLRGHNDALARALSNVLINAVEACQPGDRVDVRVGRVSRPDGEAVTIAVRDTGAGIPPERLSTIWDPYVTTKPGGTGLGLAIARQTVMAHRGMVDAQSSVGQGTEVRFLLPVQNGLRTPRSAATQWRGTPASTASVT